MDRDIKWRQLLQSLEHPFELVSGAVAQGAFEAARVRGREEGFCPLIVAPGFDGPIHREPVIVDDSDLVTPAEFFTRRARRFAQTLDLFESVDELEPPPGADLLSLIDWTCAQPTPYAEVALVRLPCAESWRIPAYVSFGAPLDQFGNTLGEEISIEREWFDRFGAELCAVEDRLWSFRIARRATITKQWSCCAYTTSMHGRTMRTRRTSSRSVPPRCGSRVTGHSAGRDAARHLARPWPQPLGPLAPTGRASDRHLTFNCGEFRILAPTRAGWIWRRSERPTP